MFNLKKIFTKERHCVKEQQDRHSYDVDELRIPQPHEKQDIVEYKFMQKVLGKIDNAKENGEYYCYPIISEKYVPRFVIEKLLAAGYDIEYSHFNFDDSWGISVYWTPDCSGRLFNCKDLGRGDEVTIDEMFTDKEC